MAWLLLGPLTIGGIGFDIHTLLYAAVAVIVGVQSIQFWIFGKIYGMREGIVPPILGSPRSWPRWRASSTG